MSTEAAAAAVPLRPVPHRLGGRLFEIGWEDYLAQGGVCAVEWSENVPELLNGALHIAISRGSDSEDERIITWEGDERFADLGI